MNNKKLLYSVNNSNYYNESDEESDHGSFQSDEDNINKYGILNYEMVNSIWEAHLTGKEMHNELWGILMLQNWLINQDK